MKRLIKNVVPGEEYQGKVYNYGIRGENKSGTEIAISDLDKLNLRKSVNKVVDCLILAFMAQDINSIDESEPHDPYHPIIKGTYLGSYNIQEKWLKCNEKLILEGYHAVQTNDGIFIIDPDDLENKAIKKGDKIIFTVGSLDLLAWLPFEE